MKRTRGLNKQDSERSVVIKNHHVELIPNYNSCGGCNTCHQMTGILSMTGSQVFGGSGTGDQGSNLQKPCATNFFQRNLGNSYMRSIAENRQALGPSISRSGIPTIQRKCSCEGSCSSCSGKEEELKGIQTKLTIGSANDVYEQEADRVAEQVLRMPEPSVQIKDQPNEGINIQRISTSRCNNLESDFGINLNKSGGHPLSASTRTFMEPRFSSNFDHVRLHTDKQAHQTAAQIQAKAFTYGSNIWLGKGESEQNKHLMAHELVHVIQQSATGRPVATQVSRTIGDGYDLTATRFSGNVVLEDVYDGIEELSDALNSAGTAVRLIQESLLAQGYTLPVYGADGDFGGETDIAVKEFQIDAGAEKLDGIVGPETMKLLDMHDPGGTATTGQVPGLPPVAGPPAAGATFAEHPQEQFAGYDDTTAPNDSLVVPVNGRRQVQVTITPAVAVPAPVPAYVSDTPGVATVVPTPDGAAVTGVSDGTAKIESREGATVLDTIDVDVKNRLDRSVAFHYVCDSRPAASGGPHCSNGVPSADEMRSLLNRVWERQANVRFTGGTSHNVVAPGDLGPTVDSDGAGGGEMGSVTALGAGAAYNVFRVWDFRSPVCGACSGGLNSGNNTLIADAACGDGFGQPHEAGHFLGLRHADGFIMATCTGGRTNRRVSFAMANNVNP